MVHLWQERLKSAGYTPPLSELGEFLQFCEKQKLKGSDGRAAERCLASLGEALLPVFQQFFTESGPRSKVLLLSALQRIFIEQDLENRRPKSRELLTQLLDLALSDNSEKVVSRAQRVAEQIKYQGSASAAPSQNSAQIPSILGSDTARQLASIEQSLNEHPLDIHRQPRQELLVQLHTALGLESMLCEDFQDVQNRISGPGRVQLKWPYSWADLYQSRLWHRATLPLGAERIGATVDSPVDDEERFQALQAFFSDPDRIDTISQIALQPWPFRIEWRDGQRHKNLNHKIAQWLEDKSTRGGANLPWKNQTASSPFELRISEAANVLYFELSPRNIPDPRFSYRDAYHSAGTQPTIAAALAKILDPAPGMKIWDPFDGSGTELFECALRASHLDLYATDNSRDELSKCEQHLSTLKTPVRTHLWHGDARRFSPDQPIDGVLSNPPFGMRSATDEDIPQLLTAVMNHARSFLKPQARWIWLSPYGAITRRYAQSLGWEVVIDDEVDLKGFRCRLQGYVCH